METTIEKENAENEAVTGNSGVSGAAIVDNQSTPRKHPLILKDRRELVGVLFSDG